MTNENTNKWAINEGALILTAGFNSISSNSSASPGKMVKLFTKIYYIFSSDWTVIKFICGPSASHIILLEHKF